MQILLIFLQKMDLLLTKTPPDDIKNSVLPMVYRALEAPSVQIQVQRENREMVNWIMIHGAILGADAWKKSDAVSQLL